MDEIQEGAGFEPQAPADPIPVTLDAPLDPTVEAPSEAIVEEAAAEGITLPADTPAPIDAPAAEDEPQPKAEPAPVPTNVVARIDDLTVEAVASGNTVEHNLLTGLQVHLMGAKSLLQRLGTDLAALGPEARAIVEHFTGVL